MTQGVENGNKQSIFTHKSFRNLFEQTLIYEEILTYLNKSVKSFQVKLVLSAE